MNSTNKILFTLLLTFNFTFSQEWIETAITENITIDFPVKSQKDYEQGQIVYSSIDDNAAYLVTILKIPNSQNPLNLSEFYEGNIRGTLHGSGGTLVSKKEIISNTISGIDIAFDTPPHPQLAQRRFKRILFFKPHLVSIDFMSLTNSLSASQLEELRTKFFNSIKVHENVSSESSESSESRASKVSEESDIINSSAYKSGFLFGQILGFIFIIGILIGLVLLIRMLIRKSKVRKLPVASGPSENDQVDVTCTNCETINSSSSKYCNRCGFKI